MAVVSPPTNVLTHVAHRNGGVPYVCSCICAPYEDGVQRLARVAVIQPASCRGLDHRAENSCSRILSLFNATSVASSRSSGIGKQQPVLTKDKCGLCLIVYRFFSPNH